MKKVELTKKEKKSLIGLYKRCKEACTFDTVPNKHWKDPYGHFKVKVDNMISKVLS